MKFEIKNRRTGFVQVTTEIECNEGESYGIKLGRAVKWATDARADLTGADLAGADLTDADLAGAYLARAYLAGANLAGAKWRNHIILTRNPLQIYGLAYPVTILDDHIEIGCELHKISAWAAFDDARIALMDGVKARRFWAAHGATLIAMARADGRGVSTPVEQAAE